MTKQDCPDPCDCVCHTQDGDGVHPGLGSGALRERLCERITSYLTLGGLFNAELMNHDAVRELLSDCRVGLSLSSPIERLADQVSILRTTCDCHIATIEAMQREINELKAQPSSEIRERENGESNLPWLQRQKMDRFIGCGQHGDRYGEDSQVWDLTCERCAHRFDAIVRVLDALAPSRQGAGGK